MDLSKQPTETKEAIKTPLAWKCTADGNHWKQSKEKKCRYCLPIYDKNELEEKIMYVRSVTSGSALPAKTVKKSLWREFFFLPHILVEYEGTSLKGTINRTKWVRPSDIVY